MLVRFKQINETSVSFSFNNKSYFLENVSQEKINTIYKLILKLKEVLNL